MLLAFNQLPRKAIHDKSFRIMDAQSTPLPVFPQEVFDIILGHLSEDFLTLISCRRVCTAWIPATRKHIFRDAHHSKAIMGCDTPRFRTNSCAEACDRT
jgi:hypothetical protein